MGYRLQSPQRRLSLQRIRRLGFLPYLLGRRRPQQRRRQIYHQAHSVSVVVASLVKTVQ